MLGAMAIMLLFIVYLGARVAADVAVQESEGDTSELRDDEEASGTNSQHGDDYTKAAQEGTFLLVCDEEADANLVKGVYEFVDGADAVMAEVADSHGADGRCVGVALDGRILRHRVSERNHVVWDCANWQAGTG